MTRHIFRSGEVASIVPSKQQYETPGGDFNPFVFEKALHRLNTLCEVAEYEHPLLAAPDGTVVVDITDLRAILAYIKETQ